MAEVEEEWQKSIIHRIPLGRAKFYWDKTDLEN